jgi:hypothetical protein
MFRSAFAVVLLALPLTFGASPTIKTVGDTVPPKELSEAIRKTLAPTCVQVNDAKGSLLMELWFTKELTVKATEAQIKNGLTYREVPISTIVGAVRFAKPYTDYRKQKIAAGVYTLRIAAQPQDGDHMGTAPYSEFCLLSPAADDQKTDLLEPKDLHELSAKSTESHPGVMLLFPAKPTKEAKIEDKGMGHQVLTIQLPTKSGELKATLPIGLVVVGVSASA